ncbi:hypothetical protein BJX66DRAFT_185000 [Aspergillus keveii]|uniref:Secreted peptide n=1 Tax=Aspergillus keveii TaxID=714993 RepID=A0ABR4GMV5_9EURO
MAILCIFYLISFLRFLDISFPFFACFNLHSMYTYFMACFNGSLSRCTGVFILLFFFFFSLLSPHGFIPFDRASILISPGSNHWMGCLQFVT